MVVGGDLPAVTAFIGAYSGGLLSEDYLQFLVTEQGILGALTNAVEGAAVDLPLIGDFTDGKQLNATLDLITGLTDQIRVRGRHCCRHWRWRPAEQRPAFPPGSDGDWFGRRIGRSSGPVGDVLLPALVPITNLVQEVPIAGPIALGAVGKFL